MLKSVTFRSTLAAVACLISFSAHAMANGPTQVDIPAGSLVPALEALEKQAAIELVFQPEQLKAFRTKGVKGTYEAKDAVRLLLKGTPLEVRTDPSGAMVIVPAHTAGTRSQTQASGDDGKADNSRTSLQLAQATQGPTAGATSVGQQTSKSQLSSEPGTLQEVIVTAQKREQPLQDVPIAVSVLSAEGLTANNQVKLSDYYMQVPGLSIAPNSESAQTVIVRGITTGGFSTPTVGITIDDVPFGSSSGLVGNLVPDLDPGDLARIEVLKGPQGTLYGASSMGGLLKYVTVDPSTAAVTGRVDVGTDSVYNGAELGFTVRGAVNVPLSDTFAVRASAFVREDPGYIDNPILHTKGINEARAEGGRLSSLWQPSDTLSLKLSALYQKIEGNAIDVQTPAGNLQRTSLGLPGIGGYDREVEAYSAVLKDKIGAADLTILSGYNVNSSFNTVDASSFFGGLTSIFFPGNTASTEYIGNKDSKFTQEIRLFTPIGSRIDWLIGAFYTHEITPFYADIMAGNPAVVGNPLLPGEFLGTLVYGTDPETYTEYAAFTDLTFHLTDRFDIQVGGRQSHISQVFGPFFSNGLLVGPSPASSVTPEVKGSSDPFSYLLTPSFKVSPDFMVYARLASGYRAGGPNNVNLLVITNVPADYQPDKTKDYEIGVKGDFLDHSLSYDASVYYIDWKNLQLQLLSTGIIDGVKTQTTYVGNASAAKSEGAELSLEWRPITGLKLAGWVAWNEAVLTQDFPPSAVAAGSYGVSGNPLPFAARFSGSVSADYERTLTNQVEGFAGISSSYVGGRYDIFTMTSVRQYHPPYGDTDIRTGVKYRSWTTNLYINNAFDRRGQISGGLGNFFPQDVYFIQPRTIGLTVSKAF